LLYAALMLDWQQNLGLLFEDELEESRALIGH
jgi:hypothetical protein